MIRKTGLLIPILLMLVVSSTYGRVSIYAGGGISTPILPKDFTEIVKTGSTIYFGMGVRYYKLNEFTLGVSFDHLPANRDNENYNWGSIDITTLLLDFRIRGLNDYQRKFRKHLVASIGFSTLDYKATGFGSLSRLALGAGVGVEYKMSKHNFLWLDIKANVMTGIKNKQNYDGMSRVCLNIYGGFRYNMGNW